MEIKISTRAKSCALISLEGYGGPLNVGIVQQKQYNIGQYCYFQ